MTRIIRLKNTYTVRGALCITYIAKTNYIYIYIYISIMAIQRMMTLECPTKHFVTQFRVLISIYCINYIYFLLYIKCRFIINISDGVILLRKKKTIRSPELFESNIIAIRRLKPFTVKGKVCIE